MFNYVNVSADSDIKSYLDYIPDTGTFIWLKKPNQSVKSGDIAGSTDRKGYVLIGFKRKVYMAHRLAWWFIYGKMPSMMIDHINGVESDNRICNLRLATPKQNQNNRKKHRENGEIRGVSYSTDKNRKKRWRAFMVVNGVCISLGRYLTKEEAWIARQRFENGLQLPSNPKK